MRKWSENQVRVVLEDEPEEPIEAVVRVRAHDLRKLTMAKLAATVLIAVLGLGAGWVAGKALSRALSNSSETSSVSAAEDSASRSRVQTESLPPTKVVPSGSQPEPAPPVVKSEPPPQQQREDERELAEIPDYEQSTKEIGRQALKKMMKEIENMNRRKRHGNHKDRNEDWH